MKSYDSYKKSKKSDKQIKIFGGTYDHIYGYHSAYSIDKIVDVINQLHKHISCHEKIITGKVPHWFTKKSYEMRIRYAILKFIIFTRLANEISKYT